MSVAQRTRPNLQDSFSALRQAAWNRFVNDYTSCVDADPGDARKRYFADIKALDEMKARFCAGEG